MNIYTPIKIVNMRKRHGFRSAEAFAAVIGIGATTIKRWESGRYKPNGSCNMLLRLFDKHGPDIFYALRDRPQKSEGGEAERLTRIFTHLAEKGWFE